MGPLLDNLPFEKNWLARRQKFFDLASTLLAKEKERDQLLRGFRLRMEARWSEHFVEERAERKNHNKCLWELERSQKPDAFVVVHRPYNRH